MTVRVRFAPSPTGSLHLGGLRTALFNALFAKANHGALILRIEDTDQNRLVPGSVRLLQNALAWAGIRFDEGPEPGGPYGPYVQSQRLDLYKTVAHQLLSQGWAYPCYCTKSMPTLATGPAPFLSSSQHPHQHHDPCRCRSLSPAASLSHLVSNSSSTASSFAVRLKVPTCHASPPWNDIVNGSLGSEARVDDVVLLKSDGWPTYHFASVIDDHWMKISHVLRGQEWIPSTPIHLFLYSILKWEPPRYAHLPLLVNPDGSKLSKRSTPPTRGPTMPTTVEACKAAGYLPQSVVHFVSRLGWTPPINIENALIDNLNELALHFQLEKIHRSAAIVTPGKLNYLNKAYIDKLSTDAESLDKLVKDLRDSLSNSADYSDAYLSKIILHAKGRVSRINEIPAFFSFFFSPSSRHEQAHRLPTTRWLCDQMHVLLSSLSDTEFSSSNIEQRLQEWMQHANQTSQKKEVYSQLRLIITGSKIGASLVEAMEILGKDKVLSILDSYRLP